MSEIVKPIVLDETAQAIKAEIHEIAVNMGANGVVRYDVAQSLTATQKTQARANIAAMLEPSTEGSTGQVLTTDGQGGRSWTTVSGGGAVTSVNGQTGTVTLDANDVGAEESGTVSTHNTNASAHSALFAAKANATHSHTTTDITDMPTAFGSIIVDGNTYVLRMGSTGANGYITFVAEV